MITFNTIVRRTFRYILSFGVLISLNAATTAHASPSLCLNAPSIGLDETRRGENRSTGGPDCFRLETTVAGLLMLDLAVPGTATAEPRLTLLGPSCERPARMNVIDQSAAHVLALSAEPRQLTVCVGAQDPRHTLGEYKLHTAFVASNEFGAQKAEQVEVEPDPFSGCAQKAEQVEVEPDPFSGCAQKAEQVEVEPDPFSGCAQKAEQVEVEPDPFNGTNPLDALCQAHHLDDYSDSLLCATAIDLGRSVRGAIDNGWGDDQDVFAFELIAPQTVRIETSGEVDTFGRLYDHSGQRLATAADGGGNENFRLVKTLQPGLYFVQVEGAMGSRGAYALAIGTVERSW